MAKFSEDTLNVWRQPASDHEEGKLQSAERLVREAVAEDPVLSKMDITIFGQGSYANDTNVRLNSDIDINVRYNDAFYYNLPAGKQRSDFGLNTPATYTFAEFKKAVENAMVRKFGRTDVANKDKCITIAACNTRVEADVVPTFNHRWYSENGSYVEGVKLLTNEGFEKINYPLQHIANGKIKNGNTRKRFKRLTRIFRRIRYKMLDDGLPVSDHITSFLLECLVWNVPNDVMNNNDGWTERLKWSISHLFYHTKDDETCNEWGEVSERLYLFRSGRKWTRLDVNQFLQQMWDYLEF